MSAAAACEIPCGCLNAVCFVSLFVPCHTFTSHSLLGRIVGKDVNEHGLKHNQN